jgi:hypothetical protein
MTSRSILLSIIFVTLFVSVSDYVAPRAARAVTWSVWTLLPHGGTTDAAVAPLVDGSSSALLFSKGIDDKRIYFMRNHSGGNAPDLNNWSDWTPLSTLPLQTDASAAVILVDGPQTLKTGGVLVFYKGLNGHIFMGDGNEVTGNGETSSAPCAVIANLEAHLFARGLNNQEFTNVAKLAGAVANVTLGAWSGWTAVPAGDAERTTDAAMAATTVAAVPSTSKEGIHLFAKGIADRQIYENVLSQDGVWYGWDLVPGLTTNVAVSTTFKRSEQVLYLFATRDDGTVCMNSRHLNFGKKKAPPHSSDWKGWETLPSFTTKVSPAAMVFNDRLWVFATGTDGTISVNVEQQ